jgi:hypothetical protein
LADIYAEQDQKKPKTKISYDKARWQSQSAITIYVDGGDFYDLHWVDNFVVVDVWEIRRNINIQVGDKFVWDKHLVKWIGDISNVDKIWQTEEIYDINDEYINDYPISKFRLYFNPLTYKKCEWNTDSEN